MSKKENGCDAAMNHSQGKIFAIGDIHGCADKLKLLLERIPYRAEDDTLLFLGDFINRGNDVAAVLDTVCKLSKNGKVVSLLGNHEHLLLQYQSSLDPKLIPFLRELGVETTLESYGNHNLRQIQGLSFMPPEHRTLLQSLLPYWETESYIFVHAGLDPDVSLADQSIIQLTGMRDFYQIADTRLKKTVVFGHTPFLTPLVKDKLIGIDTGAVYNNMLTAVELPERIFYHA